jgi:hypothetical protein
VTEAQRQNKCAQMGNSFGLLFTPGAQIWTLVIFFLSKFSKQSSVKLKNGVDFFNGVQVGVEILTSKI